MVLSTSEIKTEAETASASSWKQRFKERRERRKNEPKFVRPSRPSGAWTVIGTFGLVWFFVAWNDGFTKFWHITREILSGDLAGARALGVPADFAEIVGATVALGIFGAVIAGLMVHLFHAPKSIATLSEMFSSKDPKHQFRNIIILLTFEELFARGLFLGLLVKIPGLGGFWGFVFLFFAGNLLFAAAHILNPKKKEDRKWFIVFPQLVGGAFFTVAFVAFGLPGALMAHFVYDMILLAQDRKDVFNLGEIVLIAYHGVLASLSFWWLWAHDRSVMDLRAWFASDNVQMVLDGWTLLDYIALTVFMSSAVILLMEALLFDREGGSSLSDMFHHWWTTTVVLALAGPVVVLMLNEVFTGWIGIKVLIVAIGMTAYTKSASGSGIARAFWEAVLVTPIMVSCVLALGVGMGGWLVTVVALLWLGDRFIRYFDKDEVKEALAEAEKAVTA